MTQTHEIKYATRAGEEFTGILVEPNGNAKVPAILFITAIWGIDGSAKEITQAFADDGYLVSVPDIFWRVHPGPTADPEVAHGRYDAYDFDQGLLDKRAVI